MQEYGIGIFATLITKSALKKALKKKCITVNDIVATSATFIQGGECIKLSIPETIIPNKKLVFPLKVIFEDDHFAAIHKPAGILVSGNRFKTVAHALVQNLTKSTLPDSTTPQPVHRLDYATTGIVLAGKTRSSIRTLNKLFEAKKIEKSYYAVTIGKMNTDGEITSEINGKQSLSTYKIIASVASKRFGTLNLVQLNPKTGRRHQLRKHLFSIGNPILGDATYGHKDLILKGKGLYLHAFSLAFTHPFTHTKVYFTSEFPKRFQKLFQMEIAEINM